MILNIAIIIFVLISIIVGYKRGFTDTVLRLAGGIIALVLAFLLQNSVANFITNQTGMDKQIAEGVKKSVTNMLIKEDKQPSTSDDKNSSVVMNSKSFLEKYEEMKKASGEERTTKIDEWSMSIARFVVKGISFIAIFIIVSLLVMIVRLILGGIMELPVLHQLDEVAGLGAGFILAIIELLVVFSIISFISPLEIMSGINNLIESSSIARFIYNNNFLVTIIASKIL